MTSLKLDKKWTYLFKNVLLPNIFL